MNSRRFNEGQPLIADMACLQLCNLCRKDQSGRCLARPQDVLYWYLASDVKTTCLAKGVCGGREGRFGVDSQPSDLPITKSGLSPKADVSIYQCTHSTAAPRRHRSCSDGPTRNPLPARYPRAC